MPDTPTPTPALLWKPNPGPQTAFLSCPAYEALFGGSAGPGKSTALLMGALRHVHHPSYRALLLRRTFPELQRSLIDASRLWYKAVGGEYNEQKKTWRFPSGAIIEFGHLEYAHDVHSFQSAEYQYIGFDELTSFLESQYTYMLSRARSAAGLPVRIRSATNPGGEGHEWVFKRWAPWLDPEAPVSAGPGEVLRYRDDGDGEVFSEDGTLSRVFFPAKLTDNPQLMNGDPGYLERLNGLDPVTRAQLRDGNWLVRRTTGYLFSGEPARYTHGDLEGARIVIACDPAATQKTSADYSAICVLAMKEPLAYVMEIRRLQVEIPELVRQLEAVQRAWGASVHIEAVAGFKAVPQMLREVAPGLRVVEVRLQGDKFTRALPVAAAWNEGRVRVPMQAPWLPDFLREVRNFTGVKDRHDDMVDALAYAYAAAREPVGIRKGVFRMVPGGFG